MLITLPARQVHVQQSESPKNQKTRSSPRNYRDPGNPVRASYLRLVQRGLLRSMCARSPCPTFALSNEAVFAVPASAHAWAFAASVPAVQSWSFVAFSFTAFMPRSSRIVRRLSFVRVAVVRAWGRRSCGRRVCATFALPFLRGVLPSACPTRRCATFALSNETAVPYLRLVQRGRLCGPRVGTRLGLVRRVHPRRGIVSTRRLDLRDIVLHGIHGFQRRSIVRVTVVGSYEVGIYSPALYSLALR